MKKLPVSLFILAVICLGMVFFMGNMTEKQIKIALDKNQKDDFSVELLDYQRGLFVASATSKVQVIVDPETTIILNIFSSITHYPYKAVIKNRIRLADEDLSQKAEVYFGTPDWLSSQEEVDLFSQVNGALTVVSGQYKSESETLATEPLLFSYQIDIKNESADVQLDWDGLSGVIYDTAIDVSKLQLNTHIGKFVKPKDYDYKFTVQKIAVQQESNHSLLEGLELKGRTDLGKLEQTIDINNELLLDSYQLNNDKQQTFTDNRIEFSVLGLYQPAFELLNSGSNDNQELQNALVELINNGGQVILSQLKSQTPWGEVDGEFDLTLQQGGALVDIIANPYILFDYMSGDMSLVLPLSLLDEPILAEPLQMGVMSGFIEKKEETLNLETSFQQGELIVNGRVIPL